MTARALEKLYGPGMSVRRLPPGGEDRIDDLAQAWIDGDRERVLEFVAEYNREVRSRAERLSPRHRPRKYDHALIRALRRDGLRLADIASIVGCSVMRASEVCRELT